MNDLKFAFRHRQPAAGAFDGVESASYAFGAPLTGINSDTAVTIRDARRPLWGNQFPPVMRNSVPATLRR